MRSKLMFLQRFKYTDHYYIANIWCSRRFRLRNDLYCVEWGVKLYSLTALVGVHVLSAVVLKD